MHNQMAFSMNHVYKYMGDMLEMFLIKKIITMKKKTVEITGTTGEDLK